MTFRRSTTLLLALALTVLGTGCIWVGPGPRFEHGGRGSRIVHVEGDHDHGGRRH